MPFFIFEESTLIRFMLVVSIYYSAHCELRIFVDTWDINISAMHRMAYGAIAGAFSQSCTYPLDIVRRRMQTAGNNFCCSYVQCMYSTNYV